LVYPVLSSRARACHRNHQVPRVPLPDVGVTFIRETCTPPPGTLLPVPSSYGLIRQSHVTLPLLRHFASFVESVQAATSPCCHRDYPDVILRIAPVMPEPMPRRSTECFCLVLPQCHRPSPHGNESAYLTCPRTRFSAGRFRGCSYFVMFKPHSLLASQIAPTSAIFIAGRPRLLRPS
jgi:hypothetical protein